MSTGYTSLVDKLRDRKRMPSLGALVEVDVSDTEDLPDVIVDTKKAEGILYSICSSMGKDREFIEVVFKMEENEFIVLLPHDRILKVLDNGD